MRTKLNAFWQTHRLYLVLFSLLILPACSAVKLAYNNTPTYAYWTLDRYVDFNATQATAVKAELNSIHQWHRTTELPRYIQLLKSMRTNALNNVSMQEACALADEMRKRYEALNEKFGQSAEKIIPMIKASQVPNVQKGLNKSNQDWQKDWLQDSKEARIDKRLEKAQERASSFYGKLSKEQIALIKQNIVNAKFDADTHYRFRLNRQAMLMDTLTRASNHQMSEANLKVAVTALIHNTAMADASAYAAYNDAIIQDACTNTAALHNTTTPTQRQHLVKQLTSYIDDLTILQNTP